MATLQHSQDLADVALAETKKEESAVDARSIDEKSHHGAVSHTLSAVDEYDEVHAGLEFPTEEERQTLRRVKDSIPWAAYLIAVVEMAERFSYYGSTVVFTNFIQHKLPEGSRTGAGFTNGQSGALGMGQQASTGLGTFFQFWCYVTPLFGAYIADSFWGRYKTISVAVFISIIGHIILIVSAVPGVIEHESAVGAFAVALIIIGIGTGGFKANISPLIAEQYQRTKLFIKTTKDGERVIVDPTLTTASIYMYFYLFTNVGALVGQIGMAYAEKYVGFWLSYTLPTLVFLLAPLVLFIGRKKYILSPPTGSVLASATRAFRYTARGKWSINPIRTWRNLTAEDFWDRASPNHVSNLNDKPKWMTYDDQWLEEVKRAVKACSVFVWFPIYLLTYNQINNNLVSQAAEMSTHGVPNDVLSNMDPLCLILFIPIVDTFIYPGLRRMGINFSPLKRIYAGFYVGTMAMICATVIQHYIYKTSPCGYSAADCEDPSPLNVWIQTPAYVLVASSEILAYVSGLQYAFNKAPKNMRSLVMSIFLFMSALSSAIGEAFVPLLSDPLLVWNYGSMAVIAFVAGTLFWLSVRKLDKKEDELNNLAEGHVDGKTS